MLVAQKWVGTSEWHRIDQRKAHFLQPEVTLSADTIQIKAYLKASIENLKNSESQLQLENKVESRNGFHYQFSQTLNDRKVFRSSVKLNLSRSGRVLSIFDNTTPVLQQVSAHFPNHQPYHDGLMVHYETPSNGKLSHYKLEEIYFPNNGELEPCIRLEVVEATDRYYELVLNSDVRVIYQNDLLSYSAPPTQDTIITCWVFNPDPLTTSGQTYGAPYADNEDLDNLELNAERVPVQVRATLDGGTFILENDAIAIRETSTPVVNPVTSSTPEFNFTRSESGFEDVNTFYHITAFQDYIRSLGFNDVVNYPIIVDTHGLNGADNSNFNPGHNPPRMNFGEGGVDDAEDADVIIHEYGHAIMHSLAPGTNNGSERRALDEAVGDYFASSYSRFLNNSRWQDVYTWDGHNEFWPGRSTVSSDHYPEDLQNNIYRDADIWSATLMEIWGDIGREKTDAIMLQAGYSFSEGMTMPQAALLFLQADTLLFGGANFTPIRQRMFNRGLIPWNVGVDEFSATDSQFEILNTAGFSSGNEPLIVLHDNEIEVRLFNALAQQVDSWSSATGRIEISSAKLKPCVYLLEVNSYRTKETFKLVKY